MMLGGLQRKLVLGLIAAVLVLLLVLTTLWVMGSRSQLELVRNATDTMHEQAVIDLERRGQLAASFIADGLPNLIYYYDLQGLHGLATSALEQDDIEYVLIYDRDGRILHDGTDTVERFGEVMNDTLAAAVIGSDERLAQWSESVVDISQPVHLGQEVIGGVRIGVSRSASELAIGERQQMLGERVQSIFVEQLRVLLLAFLLLMVVAILLGWLVGRGLVRPIRDLAAAVRNLEAGRFDAIELHSGRRDELGDLVRSFGHMTDTIEAHDQAIRKLAYQDALTGLPNRLMFRELLDDTLNEYAGTGRPMGLMFIDLDDFKRINDTLGHDAGDEVLIEVARRLRDCASRSGQDAGNDRTLIARLGGDEFVALVSGGEIGQRCRRLAERILEALKQAFTAGRQRVHLSASIGITCYPDDAHNSKLLLKCGDLAMYQAKVQGKNGYAFYSDKLTLAADRLLLLEQDLRQAMEAGELRVAYQPIVEVKTSRLVGAEALLRWHHPELGDVPPEQFVAVAEASSLIDELGAQAIDTACQDAQAWQSELPGVRVAVNVSGRQMLKRGLDQRVLQALENSGLPPELLSVELTESSLLHDQFLASEILGTLRQHGVGIWLDDFGTGFSGLSHLRQVQVDGVKIDRSFIADLLTDANDLALTSAIIAMAHSIDMQVIAEGVESTEQLQLLTDRGCDLAQGFLFGRAMPAEALIERFRP
ncbi:putative bifunctional diguanylate cyclase/phosphodiesterase [Wenzhouxiangella marina]|uniref:DeoR faimly transcriptional regulator n=1 Tax=Wenzhouxiangella marina TaxID=1579979 RepID=A0A0K0XSE7_9GAMM|nr:EAL domain-containing protein [Wenzhouxiangella marina]AKS40608.1 DeoR faimly transcriptional regulator [Wenzhouxiangella marina]MBB6088376.1 diguanylate cyclase (GGDEF)-like protein [Wenzhouxiangella marina]